MSFNDQFSEVAADYARYRPRYPEALFGWLAACCTARNRAWDCATGNGQAAIGVAAHFAEVVATDASVDQLTHARPHARVQYRMAAAEASGLAEASVDLVAVAQAMHWLNPETFFAEARRVLRATGVVAVWGYERLQVSPAAIQCVIDRFHDEIVGPFWPPQRALITEGYRSLAFPFPELESPRFVMQATLSAAALAGYASTWSATRRFREVVAADPIPALLAELESAWPVDGAPRLVTWPLAVRAGRKPAEG